MHRSLALIALCAVFTGLALPLMDAAAVRPSSAAGQLAGIGHTQAIEGFAVTPRWVMRAHEAGAADYVAARGDVFLLVDVQIKRAGSHGSYYADPQDFHVVTARGNVIDGDQFGMSHELKARYVYQHPVEGLIGFEVPANDPTLRLLWQPAFDSNPDAQVEWRVGVAGRTVQYYP